MQGTAYQQHGKMVFLSRYCQLGGADGFAGGLSRFCFHLQALRNLLVKTERDAPSTTALGFQKEI